MRKNLNIIIINKKKKCKSMSTPLLRGGGDVTTHCLVQRFPNFFSAGPLRDNKSDRGPFNKNYN
jgi:hypothetical protein